MWRYGALLVPSALAYITSFDPLTSYVIAWIGSWFILIASTTGQIRPLPKDRPWTHQILRPLFLIQGVFAGFFCLSSIFYVIDLYSVQAAWPALPDQELTRVAAAQRYYLLGHAAFVFGLLGTMSYRREGTWRMNVSMRLPELLALTSGAAIGASILFGQIGFLSQFAIKFRSIAGVALVMSFAVSIIRGRLGVLLVTGIAYSGALIGALLSGWKAQVILIAGLPLIYLFPRFKHSTITLGLIVLTVFLTLLPAYNNTFRTLNWSGNLEAEAAAGASVQRIVDGDIDISQASWSFLTGRATEIGLFTDYIESTPAQHPYYGLSIAEQALLSVIPRAFWPGKPVTENLVMQRVFENGVVNRLSDVSAKPQMIVDGYLSGGAIGVFLTCLVMGLAFSWTSRLAEKYFDGYRFGTAVVYTGLFSTTILVNSYEFFTNTFFWSFITMILSFTGLRLLGLLRWEPTQKAV
jgi:hypothetical protein